MFQLNSSHFDSHLEKLLLLESRLGSPSGSLQEPWAWRGDKGDVFADLQLLAKNISRFVGLSDVILTVGIARQRRDIAGQIELLKRKGEVFIEVDDELLRHPSCVPAVICHEVMHKVLYDAGVWVDDTSENEKLTDLACVYAGLGKLMLNGCTSSDWDKEGHQRSFSVGYVSLDGLAFAYAVTCGMRNIGADQADMYLSDEAHRAVRNWRTELAPLSELLGGATNLQITLQTVIENMQVALCEKERDIRLALRQLRKEVERDTDLHRRMNSVRNAIANLARGNGSASDFLTGVRAIYLNEFASANRSRKESNISERLLRGLRVLPGEDAGSQSEIIECPIDGCKLRVPSGKVKIRVLCPTCKYQFLVSTSSQKRRGSLRLFS